jgi:hypothetical protein
VCCTLRFSGHLHSTLRRCDNIRTIPSKHLTTLPELLLAATRSHYIIFMSQRLEHEIFFECERATFPIGWGFGVAVRLIAPSTLICSGTNA